MWSVRDTNTGQLYHFLVGIQYSIGRKKHAIPIIDDPSISRCHAVFEVKFRIAYVNTSKSSVLEVIDTDSKCGTFINDLPVECGEDIRLNDGDVIKFGLFDGEFIVCYEPLVVCTSCIESGKKIELKHLLYKLGGHMVDDFESACTHLVMPRVKFTIKAIRCLVSLKPIVTFEYFEDLIQCWTCRSGERKLEEKCYIPPTCEDEDTTLIDEETNVFNIFQERKNVFVDKLFFFFTESQLESLQFIILHAGGNTALIRKDRAFDPDLIINEGSCIIKPTSMALSSKLLKVFDDVSKILAEKKKRLIPESDIGMAIIHYSVENYCNPDYHEDPTASGMHKIASATVSENQIFVEETNDMQAGPSSSNCFNLDNRQAGSRDMVIDVIEIEESQDGFPEEKLNVDDDVIFVDAKQSSNNDEVRVLRGPVPCTSKLRRPVMSGLKAKRTKLLPSVIDILDDSSTEEDSIKSSQEEDSTESNKVSFENEESQKNQEEPPENQNELSANQGEPSNNSASSQEEELTESKKTSKDRAEPSNNCTLSQDEESTDSIEILSGSEEPKKNQKEPSNNSASAEEEELTASKESSKDRAEASNKSAVTTDLGNCVDTAENQPSSCMKVKFVDLIKPKNKVIEEDVSCSKNKNGVKNFKRFKKVASLGTMDLPRIIGGRDLFTYDPYSFSSNHVKGMIKNHPRDIDESEEGEFDWVTSSADEKV